MNNRIAVELINEAPFNKVVNIGNTGLELRVNEVEWTAHFNPKDLTAYPKTQEGIRVNSYLYLLGIHQLMQYWGEDDNFKSKSNPNNIIVRQDTMSSITNERMNDFRSKMFESLSSNSSYKDIYTFKRHRLGGIKDDYCNWSLNIKNLLLAYNEIIYKREKGIITEEEFNKIRFFKRLKEAYKAISNVDIEFQAIDFADIEM